MTMRPFLRTIALLPALLLSLLWTPSASFALGIDKLYANLDGSSGFRSIGSFMVFNDDGDEQVFVTAQVFKWDMTQADPIVLTPSEDLEIFPAFARMPVGGSSAFKVKYVGKTPLAENTYRILFRAVKVPAGSGAGGSQELRESFKPQAAVGLSMTVPVYVADMSTKADVLSKVVAKGSRGDKGLALEIDNQGNRRVTIAGYKLDGVEQPTNLGIVLSGHARRFDIAGATGGSKVTEVKLSFGDQTGWVAVEAMR